jgi:ABC-2 type transporter.
VLQVSLSNILSVPQNIGWDRENGRLSLIISMGVPLWAYAIAMMLPNNLYAMGSGLLVLGVAVAMGYLSVSPGGLAMLVLALLVSSIQGSMVGLLMAARIRNWRLLQQVSSIAGFGFSFFAPVYFPLSVVPRYLLPLAMLEPTTYAAQAIRLSLLGDPASFVWDLGTAAYGAVMAALASKWGLKA